MSAVHAENTTPMQSICSNCPGTLWGEKSICRVHQQHISLVSSCPEWLATEKEGQLALFDFEPSMEVMQRVEEEIHDYLWKVREIQRGREALKEAGEGITAQYGIEASMPKAQGGHSDPVHREVLFRNRRLERIEELELAVRRLEEATHKITDEKERTVMECMMDKMRMGDIARHVGVSRQRLNEIKRSLIHRLAWVMYEEELMTGQMAPKSVDAPSGPSENLG